MSSRRVRIGISIMGYFEDNMHQTTNNLTNSLFRVTFSAPQSADGTPAPTIDSLNAGCLLPRGYVEESFRLPWDEVDCELRGSGVIFLGG